MQRFKSTNIANALKDNERRACSHLLPDRNTVGAFLHESSLIERGCCAHHGFALESAEREAAPQRDATLQRTRASQSVSARRFRCGCLAKPLPRLPSLDHQSIEVTSWCKQDCKLNNADTRLNAHLLRFATLSFCCFDSRAHEADQSPPHQATLSNDGLLQLTPRFPRSVLWGKANTTQKKVAFQ